jgi:hypothetical protein
MRDPYKVLGVSRDTTAKEIKAAYRKLVLQYHPDKNPGDQISTEMLKMINEAYAILSDPAARAEFNRQHKIHENNVAEQVLHPQSETASGTMVVAGQDDVQIIEIKRQDRVTISPFIRKMLIVDCIVAGIFFFWYSKTSPNLPHTYIPQVVRNAASTTRGGGNSWDEDLTMGVYLSLILSLYTAYVLVFKKELRFLNPLIYLKCLTLFWLVAGTVGLTTVKANFGFAAVVTTWTALFILITAIYRLDIQLGGPG